MNMLLTIMCVDMVVDMTKADIAGTAHTGEYGANAQMAIYTLKGMQDMPVMSLCTRVLPHAFVATLYQQLPLMRLGSDEYEVYTPRFTYFGFRYVQITGKTPHFWSELP